MFRKTYKLVIKVYRLFLKKFQHHFSVPLELAFDIPVSEFPTGRTFDLTIPILTVWNHNRIASLFESIINPSCSCVNKVFHSLNLFIYLQEMVTKDYHK